MKLPLTRTVYCGKYELNSDITARPGSEHQGHIGVVKMKTLARSHDWWTGIDRDIELLSKSCAWLQEVKQAPPAAPLHP